MYTTVLTDLSHFKILGIHTKIEIILRRVI